MRASGHGWARPVTALIDVVTGSLPVTFQTATRTSQTEVKVTRSLLRAQIRPATKGRYDLQLAWAGPSETWSVSCIGVGSPGPVRSEPGAPPRLVALGRLPAVVTVEVGPDRHADLVARAFGSEDRGPGSGPVDEQG